MEIVKKKERKPKPTTSSGMINILAVLKNGTPVGQGFLLTFDNMMFPPMLSDFDGKELPPDWYELYTTEVRLVVVGRTIQ